MSNLVILRLQGLDKKARSEDIRTFFEGLNIARVCIVGGLLGEAFIVFTSERNGQLALRRTGTCIQGSKVALYISSIAELEHKMKSKLEKKTQPAQHSAKRPRPHSTPEDPPPQHSHNYDAEVGASSEIYSAIQGQLSANEAANFSGFNSEYGRTPEEVLSSRPGYARLFGLPACVTKDDVCRFFKGLPVQEVIVNVMLGLRRGCLVKFAGIQDGLDALGFNQQQLGSFCVEVRGATEKMWISAVEECEKPSNNSEEMCEMPVPTGTENEPHRKRICDMNPKRGPLQKSVHGQRSAHTVSSKKRFADRLPLRPRKKSRSDRASTGNSSQTMEYCAMVSKLPTNILKTDVKELFQCHNLANNKILHLFDRTGQRTDTVFIVFDNVTDYEYALNLSGCHVTSQAIAVSAITRKDMEAMLDSVSSEQQTCVYVRNMPADVDRNQIRAFFHSHKLRMENILVMQDRNGNGIGEALIQFRSQRLATLAKNLQGRIFLGIKVLLSSISLKQMQDILGKNPITKRQE